MLLPEATLMSVIPASSEALDPVLGSMATRSPVCDLARARNRVEVHQEKLSYFHGDINNRRCTVEKEEDVCNNPYLHHPPPPK